MPWVAAPVGTAGPAVSVSGVATLSYTASFIGSWLVVYIINGGNAGATSVSDTLGLAWYSLGDEPRGSQCRVDIFAAYVTSTSANTITVSAVSGGATMYAYLEEWPGGYVSGAPPQHLDSSYLGGGITIGANGAAATSSTATGNGATRLGSCLLLTAFAANGAITGPSWSSGTLGGSTARGPPATSSARKGPRPCRPSRPAGRGVASGPSSRSPSSPASAPR